jgi:gentisate 1,2-dioxygenase
MDNKNWQQHAINWEYGAAAKPDLAEMPIRSFPAKLHEEGETRVIELDLSDTLGTSYSATAPNLLANYIRINPNDKINLNVESSSEVFYVLRGAGHSETTLGTIEWQQGDAFTLPFNQGTTHYASEDSALAWVHDAPLFAHLGAKPSVARFKPTFFSKTYLNDELAKVREVGIGQNRNRLGIILGNPSSEKMRTISHSMWALYNVLPKGAVQLPHRHNSVAIDLSLSATGDTYTLIGKKIDAQGNLIDPIKAMWADKTIFVTPAGWWHSHHNNSEQDAYVFPIQDAGLHIYMRTLDIQFVK